MAFVETLVSVMSCDSDRLNMTTAPEAMDRKGEIPQNVDKDLQTGLNLNSDSHVMMTLESDEEHDLDLYMEPDVEPEVQPALEQHLYSKKTLGISDATESTERELCSSHNEKDKPICTIVHCTSTVKIDSEEEFCKMVPEWHMPSPQSAYAKEHNHFRRSGQSEDTCSSQAIDLKNGFDIEDKSNHNEDDNEFDAADGVFRDDEDQIVYPGKGKSGYIEDEVSPCGEGKGREGTNTGEEGYDEDFDSESANKDFRDNKPFDREDSNESSDVSTGFESNEDKNGSESEDIDGNNGIDKSPGRKPSSIMYIKGLKSNNVTDLMGSSEFLNTQPNEILTNGSFYGEDKGQGDIDIEHLKNALYAFQDRQDARKDETDDEEVDSENIKGVDSEDTVEGTSKNSEFLNKQAIPKGNLSNGIFYGEDNSQGDIDIEHLKNDYAFQGRQDARKDETDDEEVDSEDIEGVDGEGTCKNSKPERLIRPEKYVLAALLRDVANELNANRRWKKFTHKHMRDEMNHLRAEQAELRAERAELRAERAHLRAECVYLRDEREQLRTECKQLKADKELCVADGERLKTEQMQLRIEKEQLRIEQEQLRAAQDRMSAEQEKLTAEQQQLRQCRNQQQLLSAEKNQPRDDGALTRAGQQQLVPVLDRFKQCKTICSAMKRQQQQPVRLQLVDEVEKSNRLKNAINKNKNELQHTASTSALSMPASTPPPAKKRKISTSVASRISCTTVPVLDQFKQRTSRMTTRSAMKRKRCRRTI